MNRVLLLIIITFCSGKVYCQDSILTRLSVSYDFGRTATFYLRDNSYSFEGNVNYFFKEGLGVKLGIGYGTFHSSEINNMFDCNSSGFAIKPGLVLRDPKRGILLETSVGLSFFRQSGYYELPNSYWGNYQINDKHNFSFSYLDIYLSKTLFNFSDVKINIGAGVDMFNIFQVFFIRGHYPVYVPTYGKLNFSHYFIATTIEFCLKKKKFQL